MPNFIGYARTFPQLIPSLPSSAMLSLFPVIAALAQSLDRIDRITCLHERGPLAPLPSLRGGPEGPTRQFVSKEKIRAFPVIPCRAFPRFTGYALPFFPEIAALAQSLARNNGSIRLGPASSGEGPHPLVVAEKTGPDNCPDPKNDGFAFYEDQAFPAEPRTASHLCM